MYICIDKIFFYMHNLSDEKLKIAISMQSLWEPMTEQQRQFFLCHMQIFEFDKDKTVLNIGDTPIYLMYLVEGYMKVYAQGVDERMQVIHMVEPGSFFGCGNSFFDRPYQFCVKSGVQSKAVAIPLNIIYHLIWENPSIAIVFIKELSALLGTSLSHTIAMTQKHIRGRLADSLLALADKYGMEADGSTLSIYLSRQDLASLSNMTTSNAIRTLSAFAQEGILELKGRRIRFINREKLERISELG